jgi:hypothetical protein
MPIFEEQKLYFIHIPKTAGTSIRTFLSEQLGNVKVVNPVGHSKLSEVENFKDYRCFCIIREPIARAKSYYRWFRFNQEDAESFPFKKLALKLNFEDWINEWFLDNAEAQHEFFTLNDKVPNNVKVIKFENLMFELDHYLKYELLLKIDINGFPNKFGSPKDINCDCSEKTIQKIKEKEKWLYENRYY